VKQKLLPHKYPRSIEFLDALPKTGTGKIDRQALLQQSKARQGKARQGSAAMISADESDDAS
jgi:2-aminobenzoate-CoA ligase